MGRADRVDRLFDRHSPRRKLDCPPRDVYIYAFTAVGTAANHDPSHDPSSRLVRVHGCRHVSAPPLDLSFQGIELATCPPPPARPTP